MRRDVFQAIADPVRREIIHLLKEKSMTVKEVSEHFEISRQAVSKQLKILNECGVVKVDQVGRERYFQIEPQNLILAISMAIKCMTGEKIVLRHLWLD